MQKYVAWISIRSVIPNVCMGVQNESHPHPQELLGPIAVRLTAKAAATMDAAASIAYVWLT
jgi:hypothetical protein